MVVVRTLDQGNKASVWSGDLIMDMTIIPASAKTAHFEQSERIKAVAIFCCRDDVDIFIFYTHPFFSSREVSLPAISHINSY